MTLPRGSLIPLLVLIIIVGASSTSAIALVTSLIFCSLCCISFVQGVRSFSPVFVGGLISAVVAVLVWGTPFILRNSGQRLSLLDNDNVYAVELARHFISDKSLWEQWDGTFATVVMPRILGAFEGRLLGFFSNNPSPETLINFHVLFTIFIVTTVSATLGGVFGFTYQQSNLSSTTKYKYFILVAILLSFTIQFGWLGQEMTFGNLNFMLSLALCANLFLISNFDLLSRINLVITGSGILLTWPLLAPIAIATLFVKRISIGLRRPEHHQPLIGVLFLVLGFIVCAPLVLLNYGSRDASTVIVGVSASSSWSYGGAVSPLILVAVIFTGVVLNLSGCRGQLLAVVERSGLLFLTPAVVMGASFFSGIENDGYYLGRVMAAAQLLLLIPIIGALTAIILEGKNNLPHEQLMVAMPSIAIAISLVCLSAYYYPLAPMQWHNAPTSHAAFISLKPALERWNPSYTPFLDGPLLLSSLKEPDTSRRIVIPWSIHCAKSGAPNYYLRWRAVFQDRISSRIDTDSSWAALSCPSKLQLRVQAPFGKSIVFHTME